MRFLWAAYKQGALEQMGFPGALGVDAFNAEMEGLILASFDAAWTMTAKVPERGEVPVGCVFAHWGAAGARWMMVDGVAWFPWASPRNKVESIVSFFRAIHLEVPMMGFARDEDKRMYEVCIAHGIMRRVGQTYNVLDEQTTIFETRALQ